MFIGNEGFPVWFENFRQLLLISISRELLVDSLARASYHHIIAGDNFENAFCEYSQNYLEKGNRKRRETTPLVPGCLFSENWRTSALAAKYYEPRFGNRTWCFNRVHCQHDFTVPHSKTKPFDLLQNNSHDDKVAFPSPAGNDTPLFAACAQDGPAVKLQSQRSVYFVIRLRTGQ